jgi:uncharacterized membrane protein YjfL (UPF0719 family)
MALAPPTSLALPYSNDEGLIITLSVAVWLVTWIRWYWQLRAGSGLRREPAPIRTLALAPVAALGVLFLILRRWSSFDVQASPPYLFQYVAMGAAWLGVAMLFFPWFAISARDDAVERGNPAAAVALSGAILGVVFCYSGGNIGDGPGWWVVVFASGLATAAFFASWAVLEKAAHPSDAVTIDRDLAAGARHAGYSVAQGLILGRGVAGDWESAEDTFGDLVSAGWPALAVLGIAIAFERALRPTGDAPRRSLFAAGVVPGTVLVAAALLWIARIGVET